MLHRPCPHCQRQHDLAACVSGDRIWCPGCARWLLVLITPSSIALVPWRDVTRLLP